MKKYILIMMYILLCTCNLIENGIGSPIRFIRALDSGCDQTIITFGTSLTAGGAWVEQLRNCFREKYSNLINIINSGKAGATSRWGIENIQEKVQSKKPDCVFIEFAINDVLPTSEISVEESRNNLLLMINSILVINPLCDVILMTMNPRIADGVTDSTISLYYNMYKEVARSKNLLLVDNFVQWKKLRLENRIVYDSYIPDGCHPNSIGNREIVFKDILQTLCID